MVRPAGVGSRLASGRRNRLAPYLPWTDGPGRPRTGWRRPRQVPFALLYLVVSWAVFLPLAEPVAGNYAVDLDRIRPFLFRIPDVGRDPVGTLVALTTAPWLNHNLVQLVYVTALMLLFGQAFEAREGTARTVALFFGTSVAGALAAALLLHALYPTVWDTAFAERAWNRTWSGGSAGCFGLMGALAARARRPWPLLAVFALWEANVVFWYLREYTPAFHLPALLAGFLATRYLIPPRSPTAEGDDTVEEKIPEPPPVG